MKSMTTEEFIRKATTVHGETFIYSEVVYERTDIPVKIICRLHGEFYQTPRAHLSGRGCTNCAGNNKLTSNAFIVKAKIKHGERFNYDDVVYVNSKTKVLITCKIHGNFSQTPSSHLQGGTCPECAKDIKSNTQRKPVEYFIDSANKVHNCLYYYHLAKYKNRDSEVEIICPVHGVFKQSPMSHLRGSGCPRCAGYGFNRLIDGFIYILKATEGVIKVGITNRDVALRVEEINRHSPYKFVSVFYKKLGGTVADKIETALLLWLKSVGCIQPTQKFDGSTECFYQDNITLPQIIDKLFEFEGDAQNVGVN